MNYKEAIEFIHSIPRFVRPLGNEKLGVLLKEIGNPQDNLKFVHVAGTNGKGSVCAMTAEILKTAGYKVGLFTSPFIEVFNERIQINNDMIPDDDLALYVTEISEIMMRSEVQVSEFAFITAVAMKYFYDKECDIVVLETGMGGKLDATNIIKSPEVAVITSIGLDHMQFLGSTIDEIAEEKCGIIKEGISVVSAPNDRTRKIIERVSSENNAKLTVCEKAKNIYGAVVYKTWAYSVSLKGLYQAENASVVLETVRVLKNKGYKISENDVVEGLKNTKWKARYEFVSPNIVIDGGHNIDGIRALKESLTAENRPITLVMAMMQDKSYEMCIHTIATVSKLIIATELNMERSLKSEDIKRVCTHAEVECIAEPDTEKAIDLALEKCGSGLVCICGSLYLAGEAERILKEKGIFNF